MSNFLAVATVTAALQQMLQGPVKNAVTGALVGFDRPDGTSTGKQAPLVNVYLYQVTPNAAYQNADLPTRRTDGSLVQRPQAALDLHYLLTFHGDDSHLEPQRLLGAVASTLRSQPLLSRQNILDAGTHFGFLAGSGLEDQIERVKFTPAALSLEEFTKLWSAFFQVEYSLSAAYQASVVLIESDDVPEEAPPVLTRSVHVVPFRWPSIDRVISQAGTEQPIVSGSTVLIQGRQLRGDVTRVLVEDQELTPAAITDSQITLSLPAAVHAGVKGLQVVQQVQMGVPPAAHRGFESNVAPFVLRPALGTLNAVIDVPAVPPTPPVKVTDVTLTLVPNIGLGQRAVLVLNDLVANTAYVSRPTLSPADANSVTVKIANVPPGSYLARVQVDGAESLLTVTGGQFTGPLVSMP